MPEEKIGAVFTADLIMNKVHVETEQDQKTGEKRTRCKQVTFNLVNRKGIMTPRIDLDGVFFSDFLTGGRPEQYKVTLTIEAERTDFVQKGISEKEPEPEKEEPVPESQE